MRQTTLLLVFVAITGLVFPQSNIDSLWNIWNDDTRIDTIRLQAMNELIQSNYLFSQPDSAFFYAQLQIDLATKSDQKKWIAHALRVQGISLAIRNEYNRATVHLTRSLNLYNRIEYKIGQALIYNAFGNIFREQGMFGEALSNYNKSAVIYKSIDYNNGLSTVLYNMGLVSFSQGEYSQALNYYNESLMLNETNGNNKGKANVIGAIGRLHEWQNDQDKAIEYYNNSLRIYEELGDKTGIASMYGHIGNVYTGKEEYDQALEFYNKSLQLNKDIDMKSGIASSLYNIGIVCEFKGDYEGALDYTNQSLEICEEINFKQLEISGLTQIGSIQYNTGNYEKAIYYNNMALANAYDLGMAQQILDASEVLYESYKALGNYKKALEMYELNTSMNDSILSEEKQRAVIRQEYKFEYEKEALADSILQHEKAQLMELTHQAELRKKNRTRNLLITSGILALIFAGGLWSRIRYIRKANEKLAVEKERAEHSEQFKQQFLANMSHEIRTPMNAVLGMTNLTLDTNVTTKQKNYLNAIKKSSENLLVIINDILDLSKLEAGKMDLEKIPFNLREQIDQVHDTLRFKAEEKGLGFITKIENNVSQVIIGDPSRLNQILINLCGNAIKFTEKGSVRIHVEKVPDSFNTIRFSIHDTGVGIPEEKIDLLFNAFQQADADTSRHYGGTGLGLSISKNLVELQHGTMSVISEEGKGSAFSFSIPFKIASKNQVAELEEDMHGDERALQGIRVLLAEDNEYNRIVVNDTLENMIDDVYINIAENGKIAVQLLEKNDYDLILMDANMPVMDGLEASRYIRKNLKGIKQKIPIIALTASVLNTDIQNCLDAGMNAYIPKPFKREELIGTMLRFYQNKKGVKSEKPERKEPEEKFEKLTLGTDKNGKTNLRFLTEFCEGDETRMHKYIDMYIKATPENLEKINSAFKNNDYTALKTQIHAMKPHLNFMGMMTTRTIAEQIESHISEESDVDELKVLVEKMMKNCNESIVELSSYSNNYVNNL